MRGVSWTKYAIAFEACYGLTSSVLAALMSLPMILFWLWVAIASSSSEKQLIVQGILKGL